MTLSLVVGLVRYGKLYSVRSQLNGQVLCTILTSDFASIPLLRVVRYIINVDIGALMTTKLPTHRTIGIYREVESSPVSCALAAQFMSHSVRCPDNNDSDTKAADYLHRRTIFNSPPDYTIQTFTAARI